MNFSFGIVTYSGHNNLNKQEQDKRIKKIIQSIQKNIPENHYEIIVVGDYLPECIPHNTQIIAFDETQQLGWITRKKNIITKKARFKNIVYMHDYFVILPGFYEGWEKFGDDWDVVMNVIMNQDGTRYRDWCTWDDPDFGLPWLQKAPWCGPCGIYRGGFSHLVPYDYKKTQWMYISGGYWIAKKTFMQKCPLDERWCWGDGEDTEWSCRMREIAHYRMNTFSAVQLLKYKHYQIPVVDQNTMTNHYITKDLIKC